MNQPSEDPGPRSDLPPPGWYRDPAGGEGIRWWDGSSWAADSSIPNAEKSLRPFSELLVESVRGTAAGFSHLFTVLILVLLPGGIIAAMVFWWSFGELQLSMTLDDQTGSATNVSLAGRNQISRLVPALVAVVGIAFVSSAVFVHAAVVHAVQIQAERPARWEQLLLPLWDRRHLVGPSISLRAGLVIGWLALLTAGVVYPVAAFLAVPVASAAVFLVFLYLLFVPVAAVVGGEERSPIQQSWDAANGNLLDIFGRVILGLMWTLPLFVLFLLVSRVLGGAASVDPELPGSDGKFVFNFTGFFGDNIYVWILHVLGLTVFWGCVLSVWTGLSVGMFKDLGGKVTVAPYPKREPKDDAEAL